MTDVSAGEARLSPQVDSAPVVMINLNIGAAQWLVPSWAEPVPERAPVSQSGGKRSGPSGYMVDQEKNVDLQFILEELKRYDFVPLRLRFIKRNLDGKIRLTLVCVRKSQIKDSEIPLSSSQLGDVQRLFTDCIWDIKIFRNPGEDGGNFIVDAGNQKHDSTGVNGELHINDRLELEITEFGTQQKKEIRSDVSDLKSI